MTARLLDSLGEFAEEGNFRRQGGLCVALVITDHARRMGLPLDADALVTEGGGQVLGLGRAAVQAILRKHGIERVLAAEGGRTSRGSLGAMRAYVAFLNGLEGRDTDIDAIEAFWIGRVRAFFAGKPFTMRLDPSKTVNCSIDDLLRQAADRQAKSGGFMFVGAMLQHLVGAGLEMLFGASDIDHHSYSTADAPSGRAGDFLVGDLAVHVTTAPSEALIERMSDNLAGGHRPFLISLDGALPVALGLARNRGLECRIEMTTIDSFVALAVLQPSTQKTRDRLGQLLRRYTEIVRMVETDPSLAIDVLDR